MGRHYLHISSWLSTDSRGFPDVSSVRPIRCLMLKTTLNQKLFHNSFDTSQKKLIINTVSAQVSSCLQLSGTGHFCPLLLCPLRPWPSRVQQQVPLCSLVSGCAWLLSFCAFGCPVLSRKVPSLLQSAWEGSAGGGDRSLLAQLLQDYALLTLSFAAFCALNQDEGA